MIRKYVFDLEFATSNKNIRALMNYGECNHPCHIDGGVIWFSAFRRETAEPRWLRDEPRLFTFCVRDKPFLSDSHFIG